MAARKLRLHQARSAWAWRPARGNGPVISLFREMNDRPKAASGMRPKSAVDHESGESMANGLWAVVSGTVEAPGFHNVSAVCVAGRPEGPTALGDGFGGWSIRAITQDGRSPGQTDYLCVRSIATRAETILCGVVSRMGPSPGMMRGQDARLCHIVYAWSVPFDANIHRTDSMPVLGRQCKGRISPRLLPPVPSSPYHPPSCPARIHRPILPLTMRVSRFPG
jgi:hypothetical protein